MAVSGAGLESCGPVDAHRDLEIKPTVGLLASANLCFELSWFLTVCFFYYYLIYIYIYTQIICLMCFAQLDFCVPIFSLCLIVNYSSVCVPMATRGLCFVFIDNIEVYAVVCRHNSRVLAYLFYPKRRTNNGSHTGTYRVQEHLDTLLGGASN